MPKLRPETFNKDASGIFSGEVSLDEFLRDYWQQKPLLIRQAFPGFETPLSANELAGLACEDGVNARLIIEKAAEHPWTVEYGPFEEERFAQLPEDYWTLLVSDVEKHCPDVQKIRECFRFIPDWRIDDLMFSYAPEGGSVGPHLDAYDVFLLQAQGSRRWKISEQHSNRFIKDIELSILSSFNAEEEWVLQPGDMLYLPPGIAHHGIAIDECITCSIGFRTPSIRGLISEYAEELASTIDNQLRYTDAGIEQQEYASEVTPQTLQKIAELIQQNLKIDEPNVTRWFGKFMTDARAGISNYQTEPLNNLNELEQLLIQKLSFIRNPSSRYLFSRNNDEALLFVDGNSFSTSLDFAITITSAPNISSDDIRSASANANDREIMLQLYNAGHLLVDES